MEKLYRFLGMFFCGVGFLFVLAFKKEDNYAMHYGKQGLVMFAAFVIWAIASFILVFIPIIGWFLSILAWVVLGILWLIGVIYSLSGEKKVIPLIGKYAERWNF